MTPFDIDLDSECVWLDDAWLNRDDLAGKVRGMIDAGDYQIARPSQALEALTRAMAQARLLALRITPELSDALNAMAAQTGRPVSALAREAIAAYLAASPQPNAALPLQLSQPVQLTQAVRSDDSGPAAAEPSGSEETDVPVLLTQKRSEGEGNKRWLP